MKSFLLILAGIAGLIFAIAADDDVESVEREAAQRTESRPTRTMPNLSERNAQRDAHRRTHLASTLKHSSTCNCGKH